MRCFLGALAAAAVAALGAVILGEYALDGLAGVAAGALLGLFAAEAALAAAGRRAPVLTVAAGATAAAGMTWALWISSSRDLAVVGALGWLGVAAAAVTAAVRARPTARARRNRPEPARAP